MNQIGMDFRACYCCDKDIQECTFQLRLRKFGLEKFADSLSRVVDSAECMTLSSDSEKVS